MKFVALVSGGKDSCFNILHCLLQGHELICLGNLYPKLNEINEEIDSYMYQTVGYDILKLYERCIGKPLYREPILGNAKNQELEYDYIDDNDETEDLFRLLLKVKKEHPEIEGVSVGAILSNYQRTRVEDVCSRLGLISLTYLWQRDQLELMNEMLLGDMDVRIIKVAAYGLNDSHLGLNLKEIYPILIKLNKLMGIHICGEGGEFETIVLDAPFFKFGRIKIINKEIIKHTNDDVWYLKMKVEFEEKEVIEEEPNWGEFIKKPPILNLKFEQILNKVDEIELNEVIEEEEDKKFDSKLDIFETNDKLYISNINSSKNKIDEQIIDIFNQLRIELDKRGLNFQNIQFCKLLIKNMKNFNKINEIYINFFKKSLPPSRVCIETLINNELEISVIIIKNLENKVGLHIQSRSYWAPCNIGPYSQAIGNKKAKIIQISGQIPLIPENMELSRNDFKYNLILSLQHYDSIKRVMNYKFNLITICYIKDIRYSKIVAAVFKEYIEYCEEEEEGEEEDIGGTRDLIIIQVTELPRGADMEWSGIAYNEASEDLKYTSEGGEDGGEEVKSMKVHSVTDINSLAALVSTDKGESTSFYEIYAPSSTLAALREVVTTGHCDTVPVVAAARGDTGNTVLAHVIEHRTNPNPNPGHV